MKQNQIDKLNEIALELKTIIQQPDTINDLEVMIEFMRIVTAFAEGQKELLKNGSDLHKFFSDLSKPKDGD